MYMAPRKRNMSDATTRRQPEIHENAKEQRISNARQNQGRNNPQRNTTMNDKISQGYM